MLFQSGTNLPSEQLSEILNIDKKTENILISISPSLCDVKKPI